MGLVEGNGKRSVFSGNAIPRRGDRVVIAGSEFTVTRIRRFNGKPQLTWRRTMEVRGLKRPFQYLKKLIVICDPAKLPGPLTGGGKTVASGVSVRSAAALRRPETQLTVQGILPER